MSETENNPEASDDDATFDEPVDRLTHDAETEQIRAAAATPKKGATTTIAWLALFIALMSAAAAGYLTLQQFRSAGDADENSVALTNLSGRLDTAAETSTALGASIDDVEARFASNAAALAGLQRDLEQRTQLFDSVPPRMSALERSVASLQGVSIDARNTYLIAEAEYYMQIGNSQLQLAGNPYLASLALEQADDRLLQLADPALMDVRRALSDEMAALEVMEKPDVAGVSLTLASLARVVDALPLRQPSEEIEQAAAADAEEQGGVTRAWNSVKGAVGGLVSHTPPTDEHAPLLTPDAEPLIRSNLSLQLQAARLALLRGEQAIFEQSLDDADAWLRSYFDIRSEQVISARQTLTEIRSNYSAVAAPDISQSLRLLRQYKTLAEPQQ